MPNEGGTVALAMRNIDPIFRVRVHWGDAGELFRTDEVLLYYGTGAGAGAGDESEPDANASSAALLQVGGSDLDSSVSVGYLSGHTHAGVLQDDLADGGGIVSFDGGECAALCGGVSQGGGDDGAAGCKCFRLAIPPCVISCFLQCAVPSLS